ncbi:hypothetical protein SB725_30585, partial [Pseudomonas sp. SIMBA_041]|uniref:hypothetical protein n=1 Tax=Pseudomonas sp. SIMBA_041 TaxID=3085782 RepID=UPI003978829E
AIAAVAAEPIDVPETVKIGAYFVTEADRVAQRLDDLLDGRQARLVEGKSEKALERIKGLVEIRVALRELMRAERDDDMDDATLEAMRVRLNRVYDG